MKRLIFVLIALIIFAGACSKKSKIETTGIVTFKNIDLKDVLVEKTVISEGFVSGANFERNEVYVQSVIHKDKSIQLNVVDSASGKVKRCVSLHCGDTQSPLGFVNPAYVSYLDGQYFVVDQYHKIVVYNKNWDYLFTAMFNKLRWGIDFYKSRNDIFFFLGENQFGRKARRSRVELYQLPYNKRPVQLNTLDEFLLYSNSYKDRENRNYLHIGALWAVESGFEKDGFIFYSSNCDNNLYIFNHLSGSRKVYQIPFLKQQKYSDSEASAFRHINSRAEFLEENFKKSLGKKVRFEGYPEPLYHFGIYDVGVKKIGIIGDIDLKKWMYRLDIIDIEKMEYLESITLPFGFGGQENISMEARGFNQSLINVDRGIYIWGDVNHDEDSEYRVNITHFKLK